MLKLSDLSFPQKIIALIITVVVVGLAWFINATFVFGRLTLTSPQDGAYAIMKNATELNFLPHMYKLRPGRYTFTIDSPKRIDKTVTITVWPFIAMTKKIDLQPVVYDLTAPDAKDKIPLFKDLPYTSTDFAIDIPHEDGTYVITLFPIINKPEDVANQQPQINAFGKEAIDWIKSKHVDPKSLKIEWQPATPTGVL